ncbi:hypothetical protein ACOSQ2_008779 [Xanthoceras sorbifolium]|uniref:Uncharacterized protein n=1 Tax=Xanthoceras sorbifolium TaxID=99658 RepID=A0ABQ8ICL9_9ROSI|nr:hypothetical protein JRO89_XS03G0290800 [Xanthoceras sorbifolium]
MGRRIPLSDDDFEVIHPLFTLTLLVAGLAATVSMILALCIRRKSSSPNQSSQSSPEFKTSEELHDNPPQSGETTTMVPPSTQATTTGLESEDKTTENDGLQNKELPLPPAMKTLRETNSCNNLAKSTSTRKVDITNIKKSMSTRKTEKSLSIKMPRSLSVMAQDREEKNRKKGKLKHEDSIWTKTIILGEKCKVSDEDDDAIIYDNKGNKIPAYHKKTQSTMSLSRQNSQIDQTVIPGKDKDKRIMTNEEEEELSVS